MSSDVESITVTNAAVILMKDSLSKKLVENDKSLKNELVDESTRAKIRTSEMTDKIQDLCNTYGRMALEGLENFPSSEAKTCLKNFVKHLIVLKSVSYKK